MSFYDWYWDSGPYEFRDPLLPDLPVYEPNPIYQPTPGNWTIKLPQEAFSDDIHSVINDYETAVELALNVFERSHMVQLKIVMENRGDDEITLYALRQAELFPIAAQYLEKNPDKSFNDVLRAIKILLERLE